MVSTNAPGTFRIYYENAQGNRMKVFQGDNNITAPSGNSKDTRIWVKPYAGMKLDSDGKLTVTFEASTTATEDSSDLTWQVPVELISKASGERLRMYLNKDDLGNGDIGTTFQDTVFTAAIETKCGSYTVPDGMQLRLGTLERDGMYLEIMDNA